MFIRLNRVQHPVYNLGPGRRIAIWVQGCSLNCRGCVNPSLWSPLNGRELDVIDLARQIVEVADDYDGVTITGGEPFDQYAALMALCGIVKRTTSLSIYTYSGYTLQELTTEHPDGSFTRYTDYLMDGRYEADLHGDDNVRGSTNQRLYRFVDGRAVEQDPAPVDGRWSLNISDDGEIYMAGIPRRNELDRLTARCKSVGVSLRFG